MIDWRVPHLMQFGPSQDCGCPMEQWLYMGLELTLHFEAPGEVDVYVDAGDWDHAFTSDSRDGVFAWVASLPTEDELAAKAASTERVA